MVGFLVLDLLPFCRAVGSFGCDSGFYCLFFFVRLRVWFLCSVGSQVPVELCARTASFWCDFLRHCAMFSGWAWFACFVVWVGLGAFGLSLRVLGSFCLMLSLCFVFLRSWLGCVFVVGVLVVGSAVFFVGFSGQVCFSVSSVVGVGFAFTVL